jgi:hypothetical protein
MYIKFVPVFLLVNRIIYSCLAIADHHCPLWYIEWNGVCQCGASKDGAVLCGDMGTIAIVPGYCMGVDKVTIFT